MSASVFIMAILISSCGYYLLDCFVLLMTVIWPVFRVIASKLLWHVIVTELRENKVL